MEKYAIKIDDMASEDAYFMATHMPFSQLEVYEGGQISTPPLIMTEDMIFDQLIYNQDNLHRVIIVRGNNGTGKSHLIRYMRAKLVNSPTTIYDPQKEEVVFLRRLNNSVRGAFSQLLEQNVIKDTELADKLMKFVASSESKDEASFKTEILLAYIAAVMNDRSNQYYKAVDCRNIAQYLSDGRVQDFLMREDGAISRCYRVITAPSNQVLKEERIFTEEDFGSKEAQKVNRTVIKDGNPDSQDFVQTIYGNDDEVMRLVNYLNQFTNNVVQHCADISSESTKSVFEKMRKDLKKQRKNLTIFIEDFTSFTGIDSELITALSSPHTGEYDYLCRVTAIIGITDGYYDQFKDNFKERVTYQINVNERSYGTSDFLVHMTAKYLNAIYCDPEQIHTWNQSGASLKDLPISDFKTPCEWESVEINGQKYTLYPFNRKAIKILYYQLPVKTPRTFLIGVLRKQLKEYFDGKKYGDEWLFPLNPGTVAMTNDPHSSAIDRSETFSVEDRQRIKGILAIWGDGSAAGTKTAHGELYIGDINKAFLSDINLGDFGPIGQITERASDSTLATGSFPETVKTPVTATPPSHVPPVVLKKETIAEKNHKRWKEDIDTWFNKSADLQYDDDYRKWIKEFLIGTSNQPGAICWQDLGIPAYIVNERLSNLSAFFIDGQSNSGRDTRALVYIERNAESHDALIALLEHEFNKSWDYNGSIYYQQRLIVWLERQKRSLFEKVIAADSFENKLPISEWTLALQFIRATLFGYKIDYNSDIKAIKALFSKFEKPKDAFYSTREWSDLVSYISSKESTFDSAYDLLTKSTNTTMGAVALSKDPKTRAYHTDELIDAINHLNANNWNILKILPEKTDQNILYNPAALLKDLYPRISTVATAEINKYETIKNNLITYTGELATENLLTVFNSIQELFSVFGQNGIAVKSKLKDKYIGAPIDITNKILRAINLIESTRNQEPVLQLATLYQNTFALSEDDNKSCTALTLLTDFLHDLQEIERLTQSEEQKAKNAITGLTGNTTVDTVADFAKEELGKINELLSKMEVQDVTKRNNY
jgi:hypothetical protein